MVQLRPGKKIDGYTVSITLSVLGILALAPSSLIAEAYGDGTAAIIVNPFTASVGNARASILPGGAVTISGLQQSRLYFVYYIDPNFTGGAITSIATMTSADFINKPGYFLIDSIVTTSASSSGGSGGGPTGPRCRNVGTTTSKMLVFIAPTGLEKYLEELSSIPSSG